MITIENRDDYITMTRLLRNSRTDHIRIKINGSDYLWVKNAFINDSSRSVHDMHMNACRYINNCAIIAKYRPSLKNEQLHDAHKFVESTRLLVNLRKERVMHNTLHTITKFSQKVFQKRLTKRTKHAIIRHKQKGGLQHDRSI